MNGYVNAETVFDWAAKNFPDVEQLVLMGSSAGAIGVQFFAKRIADKWKVQDKKIKYSVLVDSYMGVFPDTAPIGSLLKYQGSCSLPFGLPESAIESCNSGKGNTTEFVKPTIEATAHADWFYADSTGDQTQRLYYELLRQGILAYPFKTMISADEFHQKQLQIYDSYKGATPKLSQFIEASERHVFFQTNDWVDIVGEDNKTTLGSLVRGIIDTKVSAGSKPTNVRSGCQGKRWTATRPTGY